MTTRPDLTELLARAREAFNRLTPEQQVAERQAQTESWVRGEMGMGLDRHEAEYRRQMEDEFPCKHPRDYRRWLVGNIYDCTVCGTRVVA